MKTYETVTIHPRLKDLPYVLTLVPALKRLCGAEGQCLPTVVVHISDEHGLELLLSDLHKHNVEFEADGGLL